MYGWVWASPELTCSWFSHAEGVFFRELRHRISAADYVPVLGTGKTTPAEVSRAVSLSSSARHTRIGANWAPRGSDYDSFGSAVDAHDIEHGYGESRVLV